jgi:hypothetical protein
MIKAPWEMPGFRPGTGRGAEAWLVLGGAHPSSRGWNRASDAFAPSSRGTGAGGGSVLTPETGHRPGLPLWPPASCWPGCSVVSVAVFSH